MDGADPLLCACPAPAARCARGSAGRSRTEVVRRRRHRSPPRRTAEALNLLEEARAHLTAGSRPTPPGLEAAGLGGAHRHPGPTSPPLPTSSRQAEKTTHHFAGTLDAADCRRELSEAQRALCTGSGSTATSATSTPHLPPGPPRRLQTRPGRRPRQNSEPEL